MENNMVLMADGMTRRISQIREGDMVWAKDKHYAAVQSILRGRETTHYEVKVFDNVPIKVTNDTVFMTKNGFKTPVELSLEDEILMDFFFSNREEKYAKIESVSRFNKDINDYELDLKDAQMYSMNHYMIGSIGEVMRHKRG